MCSISRSPNRDKLLVDEGVSLDSEETISNETIELREFMLWLTAMCLLKPVFRNIGSETAGDVEEGDTSKS